jgi:tight adherence protein C
MAHAELGRGKLLMIWAILLGISCALFVLAVFLGFWWFLTVRESQEVALRMTTDLLPNAEVDGRPQWWNLFAAPGQHVDAWFDENGETERLMVQGGLRSTVQRGAYYAAQALLPFVGLAVVFIVFSLGRFHGFSGFVYGLGMASASLLLPRYWLRGRARKRQNRIRNEVTMFIHLLALLFDAGLSLRQALASLEREGQFVLPALGQEIRLVLRQLEAGADPAETLHALGRSLDVAELTAVLGVLRQVDRYGGELREPLMEALAVVEERRHLALREKVNGLSGRMTVVMVLFFFPALLIFVAGPAFLSIVQALGVKN